MKRYDSYKDSGVEWIGMIPTSWDITPLYSVSFNTKEKNSDKCDTVLSLSYGRIVERNVEKNHGLLPSNFDSYQRIRPDYVVLRLTDLQNDKKSLRVGFSELDGIITSAYVSLGTKETYNGKYLYYQLHNSDIKKVLYSLGSGLRQSLRYDELKRFPLLRISVYEQQQIVSFLDTKTSRIDSLIEKTHQKIELLKEKRTSLINELVTKGLNPNVEMKDSLVEWIGEIPENWYWKRMCYMFRPVSIKNTSGEMNLSVYRDYGVIPTNSRDDNHNVISEDTSNYKLVDVGDFVMNKMKCWMGSLGLSDYRGIVSPSYTVMKPLTQNNRKYLHYLLRSQVYIPQYKKLSYGVREGQWDLRFEDFRELPCLIPPLSEQQQIVEYLDEQTQLIDNTISIEEKRIELLNEYRQSLISEVVTGKRKVVE